MGISTITLGEYPDEKNDFISAYSDNFYVIALFVSALKTLFPQLKYLRVFHNEMEALFYLVEKGVLVGKWQSCILPDYRRVNVRKANIRHNPELATTFLAHTGKCLSCYKCLQEYFVLHLFGRVPYKKDIWKKCAEVWRKQCARDKGVDEKGVSTKEAFSYMLSDLSKETIQEISRLETLVSKVNEDMEII